LDKQEQGLALECGQQHKITRKVETTAVAGTSSPAKRSQQEGNSSRDASKSCVVSIIIAMQSPATAGRLVAVTTADTQALVVTLEMLLKPKVNVSFLLFPIANLGTEV
jgi:hypothetical protein